MSVLFIFDKDGTLVDSGKDRPANTPDEQILLPNVKETLARLRQDGHKLAIASNQGGIAWGFITPGQVNTLMADVVAKLGAFDDIMYSPYDPKAVKKNPGSVYASDSELRKPHPGMLLEIMHGLPDVEDVIMVGDQESDKLAALAAGVGFNWAADFFGWDKRIAYKLPEAERERIAIQFDLFFKRFYEEYKQGKIPAISQENQRSWDDYWKYIGTVV